MKFTAYSPITGQVLFRGEASDPAALESESVAVLVGHKYEEDGWIADGEFHPLPKQPSPHHVFDYSAKTWEDPRTGEQLVEKAHGLIGKWRDQQEASGFTFTHADREWDGGLVVRQRMQPVLGLPTLPEGFFWTDAFNNDVPMDMASLQLLASAHEQALVVRGFQIHARQRAMKESLGTMTRQQLLDFTSGWEDPVLIPEQPKDS